jgi:cell division protein FtsZ
MSEIDQIHSFVSEIGDDVEVQWGASIDETLEDNVRVTIIATGFEVSNIPGLDDAVGKKTVDEAIEDYYGENKTITSRPTPIEEPAEDILEEEPVEPALPFTSQPAPQEDGDIVIQLDAEKDADNGSGFGLPGWMRGRRQS